MAAARSGPPPLDLTARHEADPARIAAEIGGVVLPTGTIRRTGIGLVEDIKGYDSGDWWVGSCRGSRIRA